jgi:tripartite-type tricarboxylate transporter receptor subunit TctC
MLSRRRFTTFGLATFAAPPVLTLTGRAAAADAAEDFYRARSELRIITSSPPGGGYDSYSRLFAKHMSKYIPGNPTIIVNHMPGAGGIRAANFLYNVAPKDGTTFSLIDRSVATAPLLYGSESKAQYEANRFNWLGSAMRESGMGVISTRSPVRSIEDARTREIVIGATAPEQDPSMYSRLLNELLGTKFKTIHGYAGQPEQFLAVEKGEVDGLFMSGWSGNGRAYVRDKMAKGEMRLLVQISAKKDPMHMETPTLLELITDPGSRQVVELLLSRLSLGRPFMAPPGVPADRVALLRTAFRRAVEDPELRAEAAAQRLAIDPIYGEEAEQIVRQIYQSPPELVERARKIIRVHE